MLLSWLLCGVLLVVVIAQCIKIYLLKKSIGEICTELVERLEIDTNTLISVSSRDKKIRYLAAQLNKQLKLLREQRRKYLNGDRELMEAVTNISHDLRTPLTAICGYLDLLERENLPEDAMRYIGYIENRTQVMKQLTEELFRYSVILSVSDSMKTEPLNIGGVLEESIAAYYAALTERGITPVIELPEKKVIRELDRAALSRIFSNVLSNALKYSSGDLEISLSGNGEIIFTNTADELDEVQVGKLFDRFFSVEAARNSTGLGLAISKALTEKMNGTITARYEDGRLSICICFRGK